jgi:hypothetical protein
VTAATSAKPLGLVVATTGVPGAATTVSEALPDGVLPVVVEVAAFAGASTLPAVPAGLGTGTVTLVAGADVFTAALPLALVASTAVPGDVTAVLDTLPAGVATVVEVTVVRGAGTLTVAPPAPDFAATLVPGAPTSAVAAPLGCAPTPTPVD